MTGRVIALAGNISAGKTTLATGLVKGIYGAFTISSDDLRRELGGFRKNDGNEVFAHMRNQTYSLLDDGKIVVLDSTGMSHRYRGFLQTLRDSKVPVFTIELACALDVYAMREVIRTDRAMLGSGVYDQSLSPDVVTDARINTSDLSPQQVYQRALDALIAAHFI